MVVKKILIIAAFLVMALCIAGCTQQAPVAPVTKTPVIATETTAQVTLPVTTAVIENVTANATAVSVKNVTSQNVTANQTATASAVAANVTAGTITSAVNVSVAKTTTILVRKDPKLGVILTDSQGKTLYIFKKDSPDASACDSSCIVSWPVFYSEKITTPDGVKAGDFKVITREDGTKQTTYKGMALYYYKDDKAPGDVKGQGVNSLWYVVDEKLTGPIAVSDLSVAVIKATGTSEMPKAAVSARVDNEIRDPPPVETAINGAGKIIATKTAAGPI